MIVHFVIYSGENSEGVYTSTRLMAVRADAIVAIQDAKETSGVPSEDSVLWVHLCTGISIPLAGTYRAALDLWREGLE